MSDDARKYMKDFAPLREILQRGTTLDTRHVRLFIELFIQCWDNVMNVQSETANEMNWVFLLAQLMNAFLLRIKLDQPQQIREIVQMWLKFSLPREGENSLPFANLVQKLKPASCYVITEAWERHVVLKCGDSSRSQEEVEMSYKHFFSMFDDSAGKVIRLFLIDGVETFREESYTITANEM